ncbi:MAG: response regulator [Spirochaetales bacterium]|nr:response regulator [Spirochaetales bacterium]
MAKILIIDDDVDIHDSVGTILKSNGHEVWTAINGTEGLSTAEKIRPDLIILDVMMQTGMEGFNVSYSLRKNEVLKHVPILMLTSIHQKTDFRFNPDKDGEFLPVDDFVEKPISPGQLTEKTTRLLNLGKEAINLGGRKRIM